LKKEKPIVPIKRERKRGNLRSATAKKNNFLCVLGRRETAEIEKGSSTAVEEEKQGPCRKGENASEPPAL